MILMIRGTYWLLVFGGDIDVDDEVEIDVNTSWHQ